MNVRAVLMASIFLNLIACGGETTQATPSERMKAACQEMKQEQDPSFKKAAEICTYSDELTDAEKLEYLDAYDNARATKIDLEAVEAEGREKGYIE